MLIALTAPLVMEERADPTTRDSRCALAAPGRSCCEQSSTEEAEFVFQQQLSFVSSTGAAGAGMTFVGSLNLCGGVLGCREPALSGVCSSLELPPSCLTSQPMLGLVPSTVL